MKNSRLLNAICACAVGIVTSHGVWASPVAVSVNGVLASAQDSGSYDLDAFLGVTIPSAHTLMSTAGNTSNTTNITYSGDATSTIFEYDFIHSIDNTVGDTSGIDTAQTLNNTLRFNANSDTTYSIEGFYDMLGPSGTTTTLDVLLRDLTTDTILFRDFTTSHSTANESFFLGTRGDGDAANNNSGSHTGYLIAGHEYQFIMVAHIRSIEFTPTMVAAFANGQVKLNIGIEDTVILPVTIDIKPSKDLNNNINLQKNEEIKVAIAGDTVFDALQVDLETVQFGPGATGAIDYKARDYNRDGYPDLILTFALDDTGIACGDLEEATLTGATFTDPVIMFEGNDGFTLKGCPKP